MLSHDFDWIGHVIRFTFYHVINDTMNSFLTLYEFITSTFWSEHSITMRVLSIGFDTSGFLCTKQSMYGSHVEANFILPLWSEICNVMQTYVLRYLCIFRTNCTGYESVRLELIESWNYPKRNKELIGSYQYLMFIN